MFFFGKSGKFEMYPLKFCLCVGESIDASRAWKAMGQQLLVTPTPRAKGPLRNAFLVNQQISSAGSNSPRRYVQNIGDALPESTKAQLRG